MFGRSLISRFLALFLGWGFSVAIYAHHSFTSEYDSDKSATISGYLIKMDWRNPHVYFYLEVETEDGYEEWAVEMSSPIGMERNGWNRNSVQVGDILVVEGSLARDGSKLLNADTVILEESGKRLFAGSSRGEAQAK